MVLLAAVVLFSPVQSAPAATWGAASRIEPVQLKRLRQINARFAVPTWLPSGFGKPVVTTEFEKDPELISFILSYSRAKPKASFSISMASDGIGWVPFESEGLKSSFKKIKTALLGTMEIESMGKGSGQKVQAEWVETKGSPSNLSFSGEGITVAESTRILQSLRWLRRS